MNREERKQRRIQRQLGEKAAKEQSIVDKRIDFIYDKVNKWTNNFTKPPLDLMVILSGDRTLPKFSGPEEYEMYEALKKLFNECLKLSKNDVPNAWKLCIEKFSDSKKQVKEQEEQER